jgi:hypothetical protein
MLILVQMVVLAVVVVQLTQVETVLVVLQFLVKETLAV